MAESVEEWVRRTRAEQGLPPHIEDPAVLLEFAELVIATMKTQGEQDRR